MNTDKNEWDFEKLVVSIRQAHEELAARAGRAVNVSLTLRNWMIGCYIAEYELCGSDRASYGERPSRLWPQAGTIQEALVPTRCGGMKM